MKNSSGSDPDANRLGIALDIGTTTIAASAVELGSGRLLKTLSVPNPQIFAGKDVLTRIGAIGSDPGMLRRLNRAVTDACNRLTHELTDRGALGEVSEIAAAGNPVMEHILLGVSPEPLGRVPYRPAFKESRTVGAAGAGLSAAPEATLYTFPLIGGFVGGDAVATALSLGLFEGKRTHMAIDIGTNCEIMLSTGDAVYFASSPAGPAFEGGEIACGMSASQGAIKGFTIEQGGHVELDVIGGVSARGICGSGLAEAVSTLLEAGVIDRTGRIRDPGEIDDNLADRIRSGKGGNEFVLYRGEAGETILTQPDVRALQKAKAALRAAIEILLSKTSTNPQDVVKVYLAGAFGNCLKEQTLTRLGVVPCQWKGRVVTVGDAALDGARLVLGSDEKKALAERLAREARYVSLSGSKPFEKEFLREMDFPQ